MSTDHLTAPLLELRGKGFGCKGFRARTSGLSAGARSFCTVSAMRTVIPARAPPHPRMSPFAARATDSSATAKRKGMLTLARQAAAQVGMNGRRCAQMASQRPRCQLQLRMDSEQLTALLEPLMALAGRTTACLY